MSALLQFPSAFAGALMMPDDEHWLVFFYDFPK